MQTLLLDAHEYEKAVSLLIHENLVIVPTETVYGLAADACSHAACREIFRVKQRPLDNPLIVHCADLAMAERCSDSNSQYCEQALSLLGYFSPAPLTIIVPASDYVSEVARAHGSTVAIRIPKHEVCRKIIAHLDRPLAAPSANLSGRPSATNALMAWESMNGKVSAILDGGMCSYGIESTIVDCTRYPFSIVREGSITRTQLMEIADISTSDPTHQEVVPGSKYRHYTPSCEVQVFFQDTPQSLLSISKKYGSTASFGVCYLTQKFDQSVDEIARMDSCVFHTHYDTWEILATHLYEIFAEADRLGVKYLLIESPLIHEFEGLYDRITRAATVVHTS